jgi:hypothetical protein
VSILCSNWDFHLTLSDSSNSEKSDTRDDTLLIKLLTVIRELLSYSSEISEHNMKLITHSLRDYILNHNNADVSNLCLTILVDLCLKNEAAKYLITRIMKQTQLREKINNISDNLIAFKYFILIEDEIFSNDVKYFLNMSLRDVRAGVSSFNINAINHSLDVLDHIEQAEVRLDFRISDEEDLTKLLNQLNEEAVERMGEEESAKKQAFYSAIFHLHDVLLRLDPSLVTAYESFTELAFLSTISKSAGALKFLSTFIEFDGKLRSSEIIVQGLLEHFVENSIEEMMQIDFNQVRNSNCRDKSALS